MNRRAKALEFIDEGYDIKTTGRHIQITESMKDYAREKISKIERFINRIIDVNVIMDIQKYEHRVEIIMKAGNLKIASHASSDDMYVSIDKAVDKLESQILRYKSKIQDHHVRGRVTTEMPVDVLRPLDDEEFDFEEGAIEKPHQIVKQETRPLKVLSYSDAIMKMDLSGDAFLLFKTEENKLEIIYRRSDGNYGIIKPT